VDGFYLLRATVSSSVLDGCQPSQHYYALRVHLMANSRTVNICSRAIDNVTQ
jgi:hypothetical protein